MTDRPNWDQYFIGVAQAVSKRAACTRRQVGAVLTLHNRIVSTGYNGAPARQPHCTDGACPRGLKSFAEVPSYGSYTDGPGKCIAIHAEVNAIKYAMLRPIKLHECHLYVTDEPCADCDVLIREFGIAAVTHRAGDSIIRKMRDDEVHWFTSKYMSPA